MDEYIRKQDAFDAVNHALDRETILFSFVRKVAISALKGLHAADVASVVHCRDCARLNRNGYCTRFQNNISGIATSWFMPEDDDFCSYGERREE
jgi:hypothetical protein